MESKMVAKLYKTLSRNDTGETKSHQSGISIPASVAHSGIFPELGTEKLNPRITITFTDENGRDWTFQYIYYNDAFFGKPARQSHNEHRLTCVKDYIAENAIHSGDKIWFGIDETMKVSFLFLATFVYVLPSTVLCLEDVPQDLIDTGKSIGMKSHEIISEILLPAALPLPALPPAPLTLPPAVPRLPPLPIRFTASHS